MPGSRIQRGWALAKRSYGILRSHRSLLALPIISLAVSVVTAAAFLTPGLVIYNSDGQEPVLIGFGVLTLYALAMVALFCNTALAAAASRALAGEQPALGAAFDAARNRLEPIAAWALVQTTVGLVIAALDSLLRSNVIGRLVAGAANLAWGVATFFVVPVIALEGAGPREAFTRSIAVVRQRWGEGAVGAVSVSAPVVLVALPFLVGFGAGGLALLDKARATGVLLLALAVLVLIATMVIGGALSTVFRVALYQFAVSGEAPDAYAGAGLDSAFGAKKTRRQG